MKYNRICRIMAVAVIFSLLVIAIPASPVLAAEDIELSPNTGKIGDEIDIDGDGFKTDKTKVYIYFSSQEGAVYDRIDDDVTVYKLAKEKTPTTSGRINTSFYVPEVLDEGIGRDYFDHEEVVGGNYYVYVTYEDSDKIEAVAEFTVRGIVLNPASGVAGALVEVSGVGFGEELGVSITFDGDALATSPVSVETDAAGNFTASFVIPDVAADTYDVRVEDEDGNKAESAVTVTLATTVTISPVTSEASPAHTGMNITISGVGFQANSSITITDTTSGLLLTAITSDADGAFQVTLAATGSAGQHIITASDGTDTRQVSFVMESQAPAKPALLLPEDNAETGAQPFFDWGDIADDSLPLTYTLQVASSENFAPSSIMLEKTRLTSSEYTVAQGEKLEPAEEAPYYWRARATDGVSNVGEWSTAGSFYVAEPAEPGLPAQPEQPGRFDWLIYLWIGLGILGAAMLGYWLRRRITRSRRE